MKNVSCRIVVSIIDHLEERNVSRKLILSRIQESDPVDSFLNPEYLDHTRHQIPWNSFATFCNAIQIYFPDQKSQEDLFTQPIRAGKVTWIPTKLFAGVVTSPRAVFQLYITFI